LAHYLLDYAGVRRRAVEKLGPHIIAVLDGVRPADGDERVDALLAGASIGIYRHFMYREANRFTAVAICSEKRADELAIELLAPENKVRSALPSRVHASAFEKRTATIKRLLRVDFGLPPSLADIHAARLNRQWFRGPSAREWLG
jgi:hypothetical protein